LRSAIVDSHYIDKKLPAKRNFFKIKTQAGPKAPRPSLAILLDQPEKHQ